MISRVFLAVSLTLYVTVEGFDLTTCDTMAPSGGVSAQTSKAPYFITLGASQYEDGVPITVTLAGNTSSESFADYFIMARCDTCSNTSIPIGAFTIGQEIAGQIIPCYETLGAVASTNLKNKKSVQVSWTPPSGRDETVTIVASVVQGTNKWWGDIKSEPLQKKATVQTNRRPRPRRTTTTRRPRRTTTTEASTGHVSGCLSMVAVFLVIPRLL